MENFNTEYISRIQGLFIEVSLSRSHRSVCMVAGACGQGGCLYRLVSAEYRFSVLDRYQEWG